MVSQRIVVAVSNKKKLSLTSFTEPRLPRSLLTPLILYDHGAIQIYLLT